MANQTIYPATSNYYQTDIFNNKFLDVMVNRPIPALTSDVYYTIPLVYQYRPDLLAYDLYQDPRLWWVFAARNPDTIKDPIYDLVAGITIYLPARAGLPNAGS